MASAGHSDRWDDLLATAMDESQVDPTRIHDMEPETPLSESSCIEQPTFYRAYIIHPIQDNESKYSEYYKDENKDKGVGIGQIGRGSPKRDDWDRVRTTRLLWTQKEISEAIRKLDASRRSIVEKEASLSQAQRVEVRNIVDTQRVYEQDGQLFKWYLTQLYREEFTNPKTKRCVTTSITVYVKCAPLPGVDVINLYHLRQKRTADTHRERAKQGPVSKTNAQVYSHYDMVPQNHDSQEPTGSVPLASVYDSNQQHQQNKGTSSYWTIKEKEDFPMLVNDHGTDWHGIAKSMRTKTNIMVCTLSFATYNAIWFKYKLDILLTSNYRSRTIINAKLILVDPI